MRNQLGIGLIALLGVTALPALSGEVVPEPARSVVRQVHEASSKRQLQLLYALMSPEFTWSFGGDASSEQAIHEWKERPGVLRRLSRATAGPCEVISGGIVQCPSDAKLGYKAGFKQFPQGWLMVYFVAGD